MMGGVGFGQGGASGQVNEISEEIAQLIHGYSPGSTAEPPFPSSSPSSSSSGFDHINLQQSPFCGMISVFSGKATVSHVDERGRLVFALDQPHPKEVLLSVLSVLTFVFVL